MKAIAVIPARFASTRFPGKPLALLKGKPIIQHVFEQVRNSKLFDKVIIATDDGRIAKKAGEFNATVIMTSASHQSGTDRVAEACEKCSLDFDIVINIQGDEPFIATEPLRKLLDIFKNDKIQVGSLMHQIREDLDNPNNVKVVTGNDRDALYFSRSPIPYNRDNAEEVKYYKHVGVYAFRKEALFQFVKSPPSKLENIEKLEQLRLLENNIKIKMVETEYKGIGIDTPADLEKADKIFDKLR